LARRAGVPDVQVVSEDGSPHGPKCFVLWNPPLTDPAAKRAANRTARAAAAGAKGGLLVDFHHTSRTETRARHRVTR